MGRPHPGNTAWAKIADHSFANVNGSATYEHGDRTGTAEFGGTNFTVLRFHSSRTSSITPASLPYYEAPQSGPLKMRATSMPSDQWTIGANGKYQSNHYHNGEYHRHQQRLQRLGGPDVTYTPNKALALHAFYTYEEIYYSNQGNGCPSVGAGPGTNASSLYTLTTAPIRRMAMGGAPRTPTAFTRWAWRRSGRFPIV